MNKYLELFRLENGIIGIVGLAVTTFIAVGTDMVGYWQYILLGCITVILFIAGGNSLNELAEMDEKHTWFKAYRNNRVYNWRKQMKPSGANNFWERGVVHPEEMLEDVIHMLNNAPDSTLHFANRLY